jgi:hypothetical protein
VLCRSGRKKSRLVTVTTAQHCSSRPPRSSLLKCHSRSECIKLSSFGEWGVSNTFTRYQVLSVKVPSPGAKILGRSRRRRSVLRRTQEGELRSEGKKDKTKPGSFGCSVSPDDTYYIPMHQTLARRRQQDRGIVIPGSKNALPCQLTATTLAGPLFRAKPKYIYSERGPPIPDRSTNVKQGVPQSHLC